MNGNTIHKIIDPDPGKSYTRSKKANCEKCKAAKPVADAVENNLEEILLKKPKVGWTNSTLEVPQGFSFLSIANHAQKTGKQGVQDYVEKPLQKGYKFFYENFVHDVCTSSNEQYCYITAKCFRSQKKNENPHQINVALKNNDSEVAVAKCSCVAGLSGYCNHVMGLLYLVDHTKKLNLTEFPKIGTCTDNPQQWHKPRTRGIHPEPVMQCSVG